MTEETIHGKLVAKKSGIYTVYVFQADTGKYYMCTMLPNWGAEYNLEKGDSGFVTIQYFTAGESYYERESGEEKVIRHTNAYFKEFVFDNKQPKDIIL